jgi:hypothetical protein
LNAAFAPGPGIPANTVGQPQAGYVLPFQIDHIIARQHRGQIRFSNLARACGRRNRFNVLNIFRIYIVSHELVRLFNPRRDPWAEHFRWRGARLVGLTPIGRVTVHVLSMNHPSALKLRRELIDAGLLQTS